MRCFLSFTWILFLILLIPACGDDSGGEEDNCDSVNCPFGFIAELPDCDCRALDRRLTFTSYWANGEMNLWQTLDMTVFFVAQDEFHITPNFPNDPDVSFFIVAKKMDGSAVESGDVFMFGPGYPSFVEFCGSPPSSPSYFCFEEELSGQLTVFLSFVFGEGTILNGGWNMSGNFSFVLTDFARTDTISTTNGDFKKDNF